MKALDLFRGAGGWSVACQRLGIEDDGVELMPQANETATAAGHKTVHDDVWTFDFDDCDRYEGLIASPPCQTFSQAGKGAGRKALDEVLDFIDIGYWSDLGNLKFQATRFGGDERTALVLSPLTYWYWIQPEWVVLEQVPTVLPVWEAIAGVMRHDGYSVWTGNLQAEMYGVPQTRKRAFLIASRVHKVAPPVPTHSRYYPRNPTKFDEGVEKWVSMAEALGWGLSKRPSPTVTGGGTETGGAEPIAKLARYTGREDWMQRRNSGPGAERTPRSVNEPAYTVRAQGSGSHPCGIELLPDWCYNRPSTTIVGSFKPEIVAAPGYRTTVSRQNAPDSVRVTVHEAGVLQSFPADYPWQGAKGKQFLQCGNAVPPLLAEAVLRSCLHGH